MKGRTSTYGLDRTIRANNTSGAKPYSCPELSAPAIRPGADNHRLHPSLIGKTRHFHDGRVEPVAAPLQEVQPHE